MINLAKGIGFTLEQSDFYGPAAPSTNYTAGQLVYKDVNGVIQLGTANLAVGTRVGFALLNSTDGSVISSGQVPAIGLDGNTIVETDQFSGVIGSYPIGTVIGTDASGDVKPWSSGIVIGTVDGSRTLSLSGPTSGVTVIAIKLAA